ncbi:MAG: hypothetical protein WKF40_08485 [Thermoleophilaceae bacterium]
MVMIVLDEFPVADIMRPDGAIDARRFPGFASLARGSTWFPNAHTVYDSTHEAMPAILDGRLPGPGRDASFRSHPRSIFTLMAGLRYRIRAREEATTVCPPRLCRRVGPLREPEVQRPPPPPRAAGGHDRVARGVRSGRPSPSTTRPCPTCPGSTCPRGGPGPDTARAPCPTSPRPTASATPF